MLLGSGGDLIARRAAYCFCGSGVQMCLEVAVKTYGNACRTGNPKP